MNKPQIIPLRAVQAALTGCAVKAKLDKQSESRQPIARMAAMTRYQPFARCCGRKVVGDTPPTHFGVMECGELAKLAERVRLEHGLGAVRATWGKGLKALLTDIGEGLMR